MKAQLAPRPPLSADLRPGQLRSRARYACRSTSYAVPTVLRAVPNSCRLAAKAHLAARGSAAELAVAAAPPKTQGLAAPSAFLACSLPPLVVLLINQAPPGPSGTLQAVSA